MQYVIEVIGAYLVERSTHRGCAAGYARVWSESASDALKFESRAAAEAVIAEEWPHADERSFYDPQVVSV